MADYDVLLPEVLPEVPGVSDPLAIREIRSATIDFCQHALVAMVTRSGIAVAIDNPYVIITELANKNLVHIKGMFLDGFEVKKASADFLDLVWRDERQARALFSHYHSQGYTPNPDGWRVFRQERPEVYHLQVDDTSTRIRLVGIPTKAFTTLEYTMVVKPARTSTGFDTWLFDDYYKAIAAGAIANLLSMPKQVWTDMATAAVYRARFDEAVGEAAGDGARDFTRDDESSGRTTAYV